MTGTLSFDSFTSTIHNHLAQEYVKAEDCVTPRNEEFFQKRSYETAFEYSPTTAPTVTYASSPYTTTSYEEDDEQVGLDLDVEWTSKSTTTSTTTSSATITSVPSYKRPCTQCACGRMYTPSSMTQENIPEIQESSSTTTPMVWSTAPTTTPTAVPAVLRNSAGTPVPGIFYIFPTEYVPSHYTYAHMATAASTAGVSSTEQASTMSGSLPPPTTTTATSTLSVLTEAQEWLYVLESLEYNTRSNSSTPTSISGTNSTTSSISSTPNYYTQKQHQQAVYSINSTDRMESHNALLRREISYTSLYM